MTARTKKIVIVILYILTIALGAWMLGSFIEVNACNNAGREISNFNFWKIGIEFAAKIKGTTT